MDGLGWDDDRRAEARARTAVHCAACGGEFPGTTELHNGICDECQKLTHGPNYRLIAALNRKSDEVDALRAALQRVYDHLHAGCDTEWSNSCNLPLGNMHNPCWCRQARTALKGVPGG